MAGPGAQPEVAPQEAAAPRRSRWTRILSFPLVLAGLAAAALLLLDTPLGHRFLADRIAALAPGSGLKIDIGRIEGSIYDRAVLRDVALSDPQGVFLRVPEARLDWRPFAWLNSGLDVRSLELRRGQLLRLPRLRPGDPDAPMLPGFDIRIDRLTIDRMVVAAGVAGPEERRIDLSARAEIRSGRALITAAGRLGGGDRLLVLLDAAPDADRFDLKLDYSAPAGGLLAGLAGAKSDLHLQAGGKGSWRQWDGAIAAQRLDQPLAALRLRNRAGRFEILGLAWPGDLLAGIPARAAGASVAVDATATLADNRIDGAFTLAGAALTLSGNGAVDLGRNRFEQLRLRASGRDGDALFPGTRLEGAKIDATLDGPFRDLRVVHRLSMARLASGTLRIETVAQAGTATYDGVRWTLPLDMTTARIVTGNGTIDPRLVPVRLRGDVTLSGAALASDRLLLSVPGLAARLALRGDVVRGGYGMAGPVAARGLALPDLGLADADGRIALRFGVAPWALQGTLAGRMARVDNPTLTTLAGTGIRFGGQFGVGGGQPLVFSQATLSGSKLALGVAGRVLPGGGASLTGRGRQEDYGPFTVDATLAAGGPRAVLTFADPLPAAGLKDVRVALSPIPQGFRIETQGESKLGPFNGVLGLFAGSGQTRIAVEQLEVWKTAITGALMLDDGLARGMLELAGGGVAGRIDLAPRDGGQGFVVALDARDARFGGSMPLTIASARVEAQGLLRNGHTSFSGNLLGQGIGQGQLFLGRIAANGAITDGRGQVTASLAGRRGSRFDLQLLGDIAPERVALAARGQFAGQPIALPRRAVLTREDAGWRLAPTQVDFAGGRAVASGISGDGVTEVNLALAGMPLSLADVAVADLGLGGQISGLVDYRASRRAPPTAQFRLKVAGLTRSGLVLTSRPLDVAVTGALEPERLEVRAIASEGGQVRGRFQGRIAGLAREGGLVDRIQNGSLVAQLRYSGPADALWRLAALESFDLTGPLAVAADISGSVARPAIRGSLEGRGLQLQSGLTGTTVTGLAARGSFAGSRLVLASLSGQTPGGGSLVGSGTFDFSGFGERGPGIDLRLAARGARLLARDDMAATVTGPIAIRSDGIGGIIAGRLAIDRASWQLGRSAALQELPSIRIREVNRPADAAAARSDAQPWRFLIDAAGPGRVNVRGLGLDSEWSADIRLRGTTASPAIAGRADLVRGGYEFAGKRFELTRGRIQFDGSSPPDPRLDILAEDQQSGLTARIAIAGTALRPQVTFASTPALPQEELLSRILFGTSITNISAPEALQLGAALASLQGGGGLDPINRLRRAVGLDRLRIVAADAAMGRGTGVAAGKYLSRRLYAEVVTDGRGYNATQLEFRVTSWLSLLSAVSTIGRQSVNAKISKDY